MPFEIIRNDIVNMQVDAIVNTANPRPVIGSGTDAAIHIRSGPQLLEARKKIGRIPVGSSAITPAFGLDAKYVIHTVGPVWRGGLLGEEKQLRSCYDSALKLAKDHGCKSVAFPLISAGNYRFPRDKALRIAISAFSDFLLEQDMQISLVVFDGESLRFSEKIFQCVACYIDEHYVQTARAQEYDAAFYRWEQNADNRQFHGVFPGEECRELAEEDWEYPVAPARCEEAHAPCPEAFMLPGSGERSIPKPAGKRKGLPQKSGAQVCAPTCAMPMEMPPRAMSLAEMLKNTDAGFSETLLKLIDKTGRKDSEIYKKANLSKQHFSKIRNNPHYQPSKATAISLALALELNLEQTKDLIGRAGYALTNSSKFDLIICYFIEQRNYNVVEINMALYEFDQSLLGG